MATLALVNRLLIQMSLWAEAAQHPRFFTSQFLQGSIEEDEPNLEE